MRYIEDDAEWNEIARNTEDWQFMQADIARDMCDLPMYRTEHEVNRDQYLRDVQNERALASLDR